MKVIECKLPDTFPIKCTCYSIIGRSENGKLIIQFEDGTFSSDYTAKQFIDKCKSLGWGKTIQE